MATIHRDDVVLELPDYVSVADDSPRGRTRRGPRVASGPVDIEDRRLRPGVPEGGRGHLRQPALVVYGRPDGRVVRS